MSIGEVGTTLLMLRGPGVPPYSARGLRQTLEPINQAQHLERTINGELINFGYEPFQKYKSSINGNDQQPPAVEGVWPGTSIEVDCMVEICAEHYDGELSRVAVPGSIRLESGFVFYRPRLQMIVMSFSVDKDEYGAQVGWRMDLEEV